jgi:dCMP deaminase
MPAEGCVVRIGIAGLNGSGKTEVVRILERCSFHAASLSDVIRAELAREGREATREQMIETGRMLRARHGPGALAERVLRLLPPGQNHVIDSIRHPAEVESLRAAGDFSLLWIEAPTEIRFERVQRRGRGGGAELETLSGFEALQARELASDEEGGQRLLDVRALADEVIENHGDLASLEARVRALLQQRLMFSERPSWDEYFMDIAGVVATRANCVKRRIGALIVVDRRIISTGYNGTPRGVRNCNEGGCPRCAAAADSGTRLDECLCSHAEENAITQAAYHGVSVRDAAIYTTHSPCLICTKMIINAGIREVVYRVDFPQGAVSAGLFREAGVKIRALPAR